MFGEQPKADEEMRLAAAHRLLEVKDRLGGSACETGNPFRDEVLHALRDVGPPEKGLAFTLGVDQLVKLLNLIAQFHRERIRLQEAGG